MGMEGMEGMAVSIEGIDDGMHSTLVVPVVLGHTSLERKLNAFKS